MDLFGVSFSLMDLSGPAILYAVLIAFGVASDVAAGKFGFGTRARVTYATNIALSAAVMIPALTVLSRKSATLAWALVLLSPARSMINRLAASEGMESAQQENQGNTDL